MEVVRFKVKGNKGIDLSCFKIIPEGEIKAAVQIIHGMGEHKDRYIHFAKYLAKNSYAAYVVDLRKHGESLGGETEAGIFTKEDRFEDLVSDCNVVNRQIKKDLPDVKVVMLGHSMGTTIARIFISEYPNAVDMTIFSGVILPHSRIKNMFLYMIVSVMSLFNPKNNRSAFLGKLTNADLIKKFEPRRTDFDWLNTIEECVDKYIEDPLCGYDYSTRGYKELVRGLLKVNKSRVLLATKEIPLLFISGEYDSVGNFGVGVEEIREMYSGHGFLDLTLKMVKDARHEILNEKNKETTYKFIVDWIEKSLATIEADLK